MPQAERGAEEPEDTLTGDGWPAPEDLLGSVLEGRYRLDAVVGQGGFGIVYRAYHLKLRGPVAIKMLRGRRGSSNGSLEEALRREGQILFDLAAMHPCFVQVRETGVALLSGNPVPFLVLEWLEGRSLQVDLEARRDRGNAAIALGEAMALLEDVAAALTIAHSRGVAHRDIKPGNIFLQRAANRTVTRLLDFGVAKVLPKFSCTTELFAQTSDTAGAFTAVYGSPEQWRVALGATGPWTDVYSFALTMTELLVGRPPFRGLTPIQLMTSVLDEKERPTPSTQGVDLGAHAERVFSRALAYHPEARYRSVGTFWRELCAATGYSDRMPEVAELPAKVVHDDHCGCEKLHVTRDTAARTEPGGTSPSTVTTSPATSMVRAGQRRRLGRTMPFIGLVLMGTATAWAFWASGRGDRLTRQAVPVVEPQRSEPVVAPNVAFTRHPSVMSTTEMAPPNSRVAPSTPRPARTFVLGAPTPGPSAQPPTAGSTSSREPTPSLEDVLRSRR